MKRKTFARLLKPVLLVVPAVASLLFLCSSTNSSYGEKWDNPSNQQDNPDHSSIMRNPIRSESQEPALYSLPSLEAKNIGHVQGEHYSGYPPHLHQIGADIKHEHIAQALPQNPPQENSRSILINFNNVSIVEYIRFISRISNRNFIFDENDLQFNVTVVSEEPTTIENIMTALLQELRIHDLVLIEDGNNLIIHRNPKVNAISKVVSDALPNSGIGASEIVTQVFRLNTTDADQAAAVIRPLVSDSALVEVLKETNHLIVTDLSSNVARISQLLKSIDAPNSGLVIGQYVSRISAIEALIPLAQQIMLPISQEQPLSFVPHPGTNSIFIVSTPFLVERTISILQYLDQDRGATRILNLNELKIDRTAVPTVPNPEQPLQGQQNQLRTPSGQWTTNPQGNWIFRPELPQQAPGTTPGIGSGTGGATQLNPPGTLPPGQPAGTTGPTIPGGSGATGATGGTGAFGPGTPGAGGTGEFGGPGAQNLPGQAPNRTPSGQPQFPESTFGTAVTPPTGSWKRDYDGNWVFSPGELGSPGEGMPKGRWVLDSNGQWVFELDSQETFNPSRLTRQFAGGPGLPGGVEKRTQFYMIKLKYRKGESVEMILRQIADALQQNERGNEDLIATLRSVQWLEPGNRLVFSGTPEALAKVRELVLEIDTPMRQVFIEMLILETTITDSLNYGVTYGTRFGGGNISGSQGFSAGSTPLLGALTTTGLTGLGLPLSNAITPFVPQGTNLANTSGFNLGVIGQKITHCGTEFGSIGAVVNALHDRQRDKVVMNPKLLTEDGAPAEIFVGINTPFRTQSISNDRGSVITSNFEFRDIGTRLKITPYIGNGDIITLDIEEEVSNVVAGLITNADTASTSPGPTTRINRTTTRVNIPDTYFLIISGMLQDDTVRERAQVPCLGGVPLLGAGFSNKTNTDNKRNLMIFIRPEIIDTEEEVEDLTRRQQNLYDAKQCLQNMLEYETVEALDLFNIKKTLHPEDIYECDCN